MRCFSPEEAAQNNLYYIRKAIRSLKRKNPETALEALYEIDNNAYAFQFSRSVYQHFTDYVFHQEAERLQWGAGRIVHHENLYDLVEGLLKKYRTGGTDVRDEILRLEAVEKTAAVLSEGGCGLHDQIHGKNAPDPSGSKTTVIGGIMETDRLYRVQKEDLPELEKLLTACFREDPLYQKLIPDDEIRERLMPELFKCDLTEFYETCEIYADSKELNSLLVVSDEAEPYNLFKYYFTEIELTKQVCSFSLRALICGRGQRPTMTMPDFLMSG